MRKIHNRLEVEVVVAGETQGEKSSSSSDDDFTGDDNSGRQLITPKGMVQKIRERLNRWIKRPANNWVPCKSTIKQKVQQGTLFHEVSPSRADAQLSEPCPKSKTELFSRSNTRADGAGIGLAGTEMANCAVWTKEMEGKSWCKEELPERSTQDPETLAPYVGQPNASLSTNNGQISDYVDFTMAQLHLCKSDDSSVAKEFEAVEVGSPPLVDCQIELENAQASSVTDVRHSSNRPSECYATKSSDSYDNTPITSTLGSQSEIKSNQNCKPIRLMLACDRDNNLDTSASDSNAPMPHYVTTNMVVSATSESNALNTPVSDYFPDTAIPVDTYAVQGIDDTPYRSIPGYVSNLPSPGYVSNTTVQARLNNIHPTSIPDYVSNTTEQASFNTILPTSIPDYVSNTTVPTEFNNIPATLIPDYISSTTVPTNLNNIPPTTIPDYVSNSQSPDYASNTSGSTNDNDTSDSTNTTSLGSMPRTSTMP